MDRAARADPVEVRAAPGGRPGGGPGIGGGFRPPITVQMAPATKGDISATMTVVGNLIGLQTVDIVPRTAGRLVTVNVQLGDRVRRGQLLAKIEDFEIVEQVKQAEASLEVARATIRQREADLKVAELNFERSKNLFGRQLLAKQALDDAESRFLAAQAQLDLSKAQSTQTSARLDELQINLGNTRIISPVDGFVAKRNTDAGAWAAQNGTGDVGGRHLPAAARGQRRREGPAVRERRRPGRTVEVDAFPGRDGSRAVSPASRPCSIPPPAPPRWKSKCRTPTTGSSRGCTRRCC